MALNDLPRGERVIIETRYGGIYEGGRWAAFTSPQIPDEARGGDVACATWWEAPTTAVGVGATPDEAVIALERAIQACEHPPEDRRFVPAGYTCGFCDQLVQPDQGRLEDLLAIVNSWPLSIPLLNLYVPSQLSIDGVGTDHGAAMAILGDALLSRDLFPAGFTEQGDGRLYHYRRK